MQDELEQYRRGDGPLPGRNRVWPLYGAGLENLGQDGHDIALPLPDYGPDELLIRHDACGLCFSDVKVILLGEQHPRIFRDMRTEPVILGHEVSVTVVGVGDNLRKQYRVGDRFVIQPANYFEGMNLAYGYELDGGLSQYNVIDERLLHGDAGNCLIPIQLASGYAETALAEPWACIIAAYGVAYRTHPKPDGTTWIIGTDRAAGRPYNWGEGFDEGIHPGLILLTNVPPSLSEWIRRQASQTDTEFVEIPDIASLPVEAADDIVVLGADHRVVDAAGPFLARGGILAVIDDDPPAHDAAIDVGRLHYDSILYVGGPGPDILAAYNSVPVRSALRAGGRSWFVGAGGPMGRMHVQYALQAAEGPATILCTDISEVRLRDLHDTFSEDAAAKGVDLICLNPNDGETYSAQMAAFKDEGFDDIIILAPVPKIISDAAGFLAPHGVMIVFAGVPRGTMSKLGLRDVCLRGVRLIGHSGSTIDDLREMIRLTELGALSPNRSVAAVGSLGAARHGLQALIDTVYPGKVVIYPQIRDMSITPLSELKDRLPTVYRRLRDGREWTVEAEAEFLRLML